MPALAPAPMRSILMPSVSSRSDAIGQTPKTPIEPVMLAG
jgi:hypothetical protein